MFDEYTESIQRLLGMGAWGAPQTTDYSTRAPDAWQQEIMATPGFNPVASGGGGIASNSSFWGSMLGNPKTGAQGWGGLALGAASALGNSWMGKKHYGLAKDSLKDHQRQYNQNYAAQRQTLNTQLEDRQRARVASNPGAYQSVGEYMDQNRIR